MALIKETEVKGITCDYWKIINIKTNVLDNNTQVTLAVYPSSTVRDADDNNYQDMRQAFVDGVDKIRSELYVLVKAQEDLRDTGEVNEDGEPIMENINFFADATDDI